MSLNTSYSSQKSWIRETLNLSTCVDSSTHVNNIPKQNRTDRNGQKQTETEKKNRQKRTETVATDSNGQKTKLKRDKTERN